MNPLFNNTKIRVTPEQSKRVQELAFENGLKWISGITYVKLKGHPYMFFTEADRISVDMELDKYNESDYREITFSDLFPEKKEDSNDLSSWSPADLWAAEQKCERMYIAAIPKHETSLWNKRAAKYHNELLKRIESGTK